MKKLLAFIAVGALWASTGIADENQWEKCGDTTATNVGDRTAASGGSTPGADRGTIVLGVGGTGKCFMFNYSNDLDDDHEEHFSVLSSTVLACYEPDFDGTDTTGDAEVFRCVPGETGTTAQYCRTVHDSADWLQGAGGGPSTQTRCVRLGQGEYIVQLDATHATANAIFTVEEEREAAGDR